MDIEAIVALEPDLVYVFYDRFNADLERAGLKVLYMKSLSHGFTEVADQIRMWGAITGGTEEAEHVAGDFDERVHDIEHKMEEVEDTWTVYSHGFDWWTPGRNTLVNDVFELLKLENVADFEGYQQINPEIIVANEPDIIMADSVESVTEDPGAFHPAHGGRSESYRAPHIRDERRELIQRGRSPLHRRGGGVRGLGLPGSVWRRQSFALMAEDVFS